jgi:hypothetical protein
MLGVVIEGSEVVTGCEWYGLVPRYFVSSPFVGLSNV